MAVTNTFLYPPQYAANEGHRRYKIMCSNVSDGTDETDAIKVNLVDILRKDGQPAERLVVEAIDYSSMGYTSLILEFDRAASDVHIATLPGDGEGTLDARSFGGIVDTGEGSTGNIVLTSAGASSGDMYNIILHLRAK